MGAKQMSLKILTLDDEPSITEIVGEFLELSVTADLTILNDSVEAMELVEKNKFDIIITDHRMPKFSGIDLLKNVRKETSINSETPILILTATNNEVESELNGQFKDVKVLNKVESLHLIGSIVKDLFELV